MYMACFKILFQSWGSYYVDMWTTQIVVYTFRDMTTDTSLKNIRTSEYRPENSISSVSFVTKKKKNNTHTLLGPPEVTKR